MVRLSNQTLIKIASIGGIITCSTGMLYHSAVQYRIRQSDYYTEALKTIKSNRAAVSLLGEPIREGSLDLSNKNNFCNTNEAQLEVPLKGSKQNGTLYFWAQNERKKWNVKRIELGLKNEPNRRLLIKNVEQ